MKSHVYLDDIRKPPFGWDLVRTADECIERLKTGDVEYLSLDHDLVEEHYDSAYWGTGQYVEKTGYDVVKWMVENNVWPSVSITLHTANPVGRQNMRQMIMRYKPDSLLVHG